MNIAIIGDGIAARALLYNISRLNTENLEIIQFTSPDISVCSRNSTAVVAKRATQAGISDLGDLIVQAYDEFELFMQDFEGEGIEVSSEYVISKNLEAYQAKIKPRYSAVYEEESGEELKSLGINHRQKYFKEKAFLIDPDLFLDSLNKQYTSRLNLKQVEDKIIHQNKLNLQGEKSDYGPFDKIIYCIGSIPQFVLEEKSQAVAGTFWELKAQNEKSFSLSCDSRHYMQKKNMTLFGSTSNPDSFEKDKEGLQEIFSFTSPLVDREYLLSEGQIKVGVRYKGKKRMPKIGRIEHNTFCVANLYKNGWSMAFLAAKKIINQLKL